MFSSVLAAAPPGSGGTSLFVLGLVVVGGWLISLWLHPFAACRTCKGTPKSFGKIYTRSFDLCRACEGRGRRVRPGAQMFARNRDIR